MIGSQARGVLCAACVALSAAVAASDDNLPMVRATSRSVDVEDGGRLHRGLWTISPETALDTYEARASAQSRKITFRTDIDAISFDVLPGRDYDFVVLLAGKRCCHTRISTHRERPRGAGEIPFTLGADDKIHVVGRINDSRPLDIEVDFGADSLTLFPSGLEKQAAPHVDGTAANLGTGGVVDRALSKDNRLAVGAFAWPHESLILIEKQSDLADGIIGYAQFDDKIVEIDYDAMILRVSDSPPARVAAWTKLPLTFVQHLPAATASIEAGGKLFDVPLVLDTGSNLSLFLSHQSIDKLPSLGSLPHLGTSEMRGTGNGTVRTRVVGLDWIRLGDLGLLDLPAHVENPDGPDGLSGHLGMDVLKRFNTILDLHDDVAYFSPSRLTAMPYRQNYRTGRLWKSLAAGAALAIAAGIFVYFRRRLARESREENGD